MSFWSIAIVLKPEKWIRRVSEVLEGRFRGHKQRQHSHLQKGRSMDKGWRRALWKGSGRTTLPPHGEACVLLALVLLTDGLE